MQSEPSKVDPLKRKRCWLQFSLRSLLIFTRIVAVACAWRGRKIERKRKEREAAEAIVKLGGEVWHDRELAPGVWFMLIQSPPKPNALERFHFFIESTEPFRPISFQSHSQALRSVLAWPASFACSYCSYASA